jgi:hypothetical protein
VSTDPVTAAWNALSVCAVFGVMKGLPTISRRRVSHFALWFAVGTNLVAVGLHLWAGHVGQAALQSTLPVLLLAVASVSDRYNAWLDARIEKAQVDRDLAKQAFKAMTRGLASGDVKVQMGVDRKPWAN